MSKKIILALCAVFIATSTPAFADDHGKRGHNDAPYWQGRHNNKHSRDYHRRGDTIVILRANRHWSPPPQHHVNIKRYVRRPAPVYRHRYSYRHRDDSLALFAILALQIADVLNDSQRQNYALAQQRAISAPIGETIQWHDGGAYGRVIPTREGSDTAGRYCREFQQEITVGNQRQSGYGIACRQPDGAWEIVS